MNITLKAVAAQACRKKMMLAATLPCNWVDPVYLNSLPHQTPLSPTSHPLTTEQSHKMNKVEMIEKSKSAVERVDAGEQSVSSGLVKSKAGVGDKGVSSGLEKSKADVERITDVGGEGVSTEETSSEVVRESEREEEEEEGVAAALQQSEEEEDIK